MVVWSYLITWWIKGKKERNTNKKWTARMTLVFSCNRAKAALGEFFASAKLWWAELVGKCACKRYHVPKVCVSWCRNHKYNKENNKDRARLCAKTIFFFDNWCSLFQPEKHRTGCFGCKLIIVFWLYSPFALQIWEK